MHRLIWRVGGLVVGLPLSHLVLGAVSATTLTLVPSRQVGLGISTLLLYVPTPLAATHQSGSLALLSVALWLMAELRRLPK